jgi:putative ABC transport system permease protein
LFVRALARDHESAVRTALGAGRWAMVRLTLHEAILLGLGAAPFAWGVASLVLLALATSLGEDLARVGSVTMGARTALVALALLLLTTALLAAWPAWHVATRTAHPRTASHVVTDAPSRRRVRRLLVGAQIACSTLLVVLALLFARSLDRLLDAPRGFDPTGVIALRYDLDWEQPKREIDALAERVLASTGSTPGVTATGIVDRFPLMGGTQSTRVRLFGEPTVPGDRPDVSVRSATPGYFAAMGIPFIGGGPYVDGRDAAARAQVVVNVAFARRYFGTTDVLGRRLAVDWENRDPRWLEIVGVVGDVRQGMRDEVPVPEVYRPWAQAFWPLLHVAVRGDGAPGMAARLRDRLRAEVPDHPIAQLTSLDEVMADGAREPRAIARALAVCALTTAGLAMIGLYGLLAGEMLGRRREVGIRLALGAREGRLRAWLLRPGAWLCAIGIVAGVVASVPVARAIESQLFGVTSSDLSVRAVSGLVLAAAAMCAAVVPAWRIVGPRALHALRYE